MAVAPSLKATVPVGFEPVTVALIVVLWLTNVGLTVLELKTVVVAPGALTVCVNAPETLAALAMSPP